MSMPPVRPRLQRRLMWAFTGYTLLVSALFALFAMTFVYTVEDQFFDRILRHEARRQQDHQVNQGGWIAPVDAFVRLYRPGQALPADLAHARAARPQSRELGGSEGRHYHLLELQSPDGQLSLLVAEVSGQLVVRPMRQQLLSWLSAWGVGLALLALALGWGLARRTSAPLARLVAAVAQSRPEQLPTDLADPQADDEIGQLARHLARLNARTRAFIAREQAFTGDASHELRTPLAVLRIGCESLGARGTPDERAQLASMSAAIWQLQQTLDLLLALAREPAAEPASEGFFALLPLVEQVVLAHAPLLDAEGVDLQVEVGPALQRRGPAAITRLLLASLLGNALAHRRSALIRIEADAQRLSVCNHSTPPPPALLEADAAGRHPGLKGSDSAGLGLGLNIAQRLAQRHGLRLELSHADGMTCASLLDGARPAD